MQKKLVFGYLFFFLSCLGATELSLEEKVGQLFVAPLCPTHGRIHVEGVRRLLKEKKVGGIIVMGGEQAEQCAMLTELQAMSRASLLVFQDAERGVGMRLSDFPPLPENLTLGAIQDLELLRAFGKEVARQCHLVGIMSPLAPVVDVNSNPKNPIIHKRAFGDDPFLVGECGLAVMEGIQEGGILACAKHFPGHGDTHIDSHMGLPTIGKSLSELQHLELVPFQKLIDGGVDMVMTGHLHFPALSPFPATLSPEITTGLLRKEMGFEGVIVTDALNMGALSLNYPLEEVVLGAFHAGADLLLTATSRPMISQFLIEEGIPRAIDLLVEKCRLGEICEGEIDERVERIARARKKVENRGIKEDVDLMQKLFHAAITLVGAPFHPLKRGDELALVASRADAELEELLAGAKVYSFDNVEEIPEGARIVVSYRRGDPAEKIPREALIFLMDTPYLLEGIPKSETVLVGYEDRLEAKRALVQVAYGENPPLGKLPLSVR